MASNMTFNILVDLDAQAAAAHIDELEKDLRELSDKRISLEIDDAEFQVKAKDIKARLDQLATRHPNIDVRIDATRALAELRAAQAASDRLDGKTVTVDVDDRGSAARTTGNINALLLTGLTLGPAIIPVAASVAAALASMGTGALAGITGIGVAALGFHGVSDVVTALGKTHVATGTTAAQSAAQQISAANAIANAQDSLRSATQNVRLTQEQAALAVSAALGRQRSAEQSLIDVQRSALRAQQDLTRARHDARRSLEDLAFAVQDNALAQRQAQLDLAKAEADLTQYDAATGGAPSPQRDQAALTVDRTRQQQKELAEQGRRLAADKKAADTAGVEGSRQVTAAQDALVAAHQRVVSSQGAVRDAATEVTQAQLDGARRVEQAHQSVTQAQRGLTAAMAQQAAQASATAGGVDKLAQAMGKLTPQGRQFARFVHDDLKPKIKDLQDTAQAGLLPGVELGLRRVFPLFPELKGLVGDVSVTLGDMAARAGAALNDPFWVGFIGFVKAEAGPNLRVFGGIMGNLATGAAGLTQAFNPLWTDMGAGLKDLTGKWAEFGKTAGQNPDFQRFLAYVREHGPQVVATLGHLAEATGRILVALAPVGGVVLTVVDGFAQFVNVLPPEVLGPIAIGVWGIFFAFQAMKAVTGIITAITVAKWLWVAAQWAINAAMYANPIGIVIAALVLLGGTIYLVVKHWDWFREKGVQAWNLLRDAGLYTWNNVLRPLFYDWILPGLRVVGDAFMYLPNLIRDNWDKIREYATNPIKFVVDIVYNNGIVPVWNSIAGVFGLGKLQPLKFAGGGIIPGYAPGIDDVPILASRGEGILVPEAVRGLGPGFVHWANKHFSGGRASSTGTLAFAEGGVVGAIGGAATAAWDMLTDPLGTLRRLFSGVLGSAAGIPGTGALRDALANLPNKIIDAIVDKAKNLVTSIGGGDGGSGVQRWAPMVGQALNIMGQPSGHTGITLRRMNQESGGNPTIVNKWDINWQRGTPSVGLMQVIGPTYRANKVLDQGPYSYGVSVDPLANTLASMKYAIGRYGALPAAYNKAGGYARGGIIDRPTLGVLGEAGPEVVLPLNRPQRAQQLLRMAGAHGGGATITIGPVYLSDAVDVDMLADRLAFHATTASLG